MKKLIIIPLLFFALLLNAATYYCATDGDDDTGDGSIGNPWADPEYACQQLSAGDTLYIRGGIYYGVDTEIRGFTDRQILYINGDGAAWDQGTAANPIVVMGYPTETVILDGTNLDNTSGERRGIYLTNAEYWEFIDIEVRNVRIEGSGEDITYGVSIASSEHCTFTRCKSHANDGYGYHLWVGSNYLTATISKTTFHNCDAWDNYSLLDGGNRADGFSILCLNPADTIYMIGCRAWYNSDDGFDWGWTNGVIIADRCWAFKNGRGTAGAGNGFKYGHARDSNVVVSYFRIITNCLAFENGMHGFHDNNSPEGKVKMYNNVAYKNGWDGVFRGINISANVESIFRNNISDENAGSSNWDVTLQSNNIQDHNSWNMSPNTVYTSGTSRLARTNLTTADQFVSLDSAGVAGARESDGDVPVLTYLHLKETSAYTGTGIGVGLIYDGDSLLVNEPPDIGAFAYDAGDPPPPPLPPQVTTDEITSYSPYKTTVSGEVLDDGGGTIGAKGIVWGTAINPTLSDNSLETWNESSTEFWGVLRALKQNTTYYFRSYVGNETDTTYGEVRYFTTPQMGALKNGTKAIKNGTKIVIY